MSDSMASFAGTDDEFTYWPSGRKLSLAQRERKRAKNRVSAREARQRDKDRLARLQEELKLIKSAWSKYCPVLLEDAVELPFHMNPNITVRDDYRSSSQEDSSALTTLTPSGQTSSRDQNPSLFPAQTGFPSSSLSNADHVCSISYSNELEVLPPELMSQWTTVDDKQPVMGFNGMQGPESLQPPTMFDLLNSNNDHLSIVGSAYGSGQSIQIHPFRQPDECRSITELLNNICIEATALDASQICIASVLLDDLLAKVMLFGWDAAIASTGIKCPLQVLIRRIDEEVIIESGCGFMERVTIMRCVTNMALHLIVGKTGARQEIWPWYRARPSQLSMRHDPIADFFVWPQMRERLAFHSMTLMTNRFWRRWFSNYKFFWPGEPGECFEFSDVTGKYQICGELMNRMGDINHWRMKTDFFDHFPAFADDLLPAETIPQYISLWKTADEQYRKRRKRRHETAATRTGQSELVPAQRKRLDFLAQDLDVDPGFS